MSCPPRIPLEPARERSSRRRGTKREEARKKITDGALLRLDLRRGAAFQGRMEKWREREPHWRARVFRARHRELLVEGDNWPQERRRAAAGARRCVVSSCLRGGDDTHAATTTPPHPRRARCLRTVTCIQGHRHQYDLQGHRHLYDQGRVVQGHRHRRTSTPVGAWPVFRFYQSLRPKAGRETLTSVPR